VDRERNAKVWVNLCWLATIHPSVVEYYINMSWISYLTGTRNTSRDSTREAIVNLREHLLMLEKKEDHLNKKIEDELKKAKANATTNKRGKSTILPFLITDFRYPRAWHRSINIHPCKVGQILTLAPLCIRIQ
jgi:hypothetical protein